MSICSNCCIDLDDNNYAAEGLCDDCYYDKVIDKESEFEEIETIDDEISDMVDEIMLLVYDRSDDV